MSASRQRGLYQGMTNMCALFVRKVHVTQMLTRVNTACSAWEPDSVVLSVVG